MKQRGRKSTAKLSVAPTPIDNRPLPPETLTKTEKERFNRIVASRDADFFDETTLILLVELCRLHTECDTVGAQIKDFEDGWLSTDEGVNRYKSLTQIQDRAQGRLIALARSLRLTPQSRFVPDSRKTQAKAARPAKVWQREN